MMMDEPHQKSASTNTLAHRQHTDTRQPSKALSWRQLRATACLELMRRVAA